ncbi:MAG TPA: Wzz/FepE/Etk N-terminal domain-containing protein [Steroidobacteraceae bacterium]|nr:Wzz/FepE/Etk N-terminal domain-containing protein [Steroidobacteraceae bacterium]
MNNRTIPPDSPLRTINTLWREKWLIGAITLLVAAIFVAYAFLATPRYLAEVKLIPAQESADERALAGLAGQFGGLAELAGIQLGGSGERQAKAVAVLKSRSFATEFIQDFDLVKVLFASDWDADAGRWKPSDPEDIPTLQDAYERFDRKIRRVGEDQKTGAVTLGIVWRDREQAAAWANELAARLNERLRQEEIAEARRSLEYIETQAAKTDVASIRETLFRLAEAQLRRQMLASVRKDFAFSVIDPATVSDPDRFEYPKRALLAALGLVFGFICGVGVVLARRFVADARRIDDDRSMPNESSVRSARPEPTSSS